MKHAIPFLLVALFSASAFAQQTDPRKTIDLAGQWRFAMDPKDEGVNKQWFTTTLADHINLPGILQSQGYGDPITLDTPWVLGLGNKTWLSNPAYDRYKHPGDIKVPFLSQPPRHYLGPAWYQRDVDVPNYGAKNFILSLERAHWQSTVWLDGKTFGSCNSLVAPHEFVLGEITPGHHQLTIRMDNRMILPYRPDGHSVSDALGATWNGIVGKIQLTATSTAWLDDVQAFPDVDKKTLTLRAHVVSAMSTPGQGALHVGGATADISWNNTGGDGSITVPLPADAKLWDEFHPNLQKVTITLTSGADSDAKTITYGVREVKAVDTKMMLNGHQIYVRATHSGGDFPLTGYPATDVDSWKKIFQVCKNYGLNAMRFHSWCPPDAAFTAADELGFYIQPECGMWNNFSDARIPAMLQDETARMEKAYGNHPSYLLLSPTNEPAGAWTRYLPQWTATWHDKDPRRLYAENTGRVNLRDTGPTYAITPARGIRGWFGKDYSSMLQNVHVPVLSHEVGQWCAYPDFDVIQKFTGYLQPGNYEIFRDSAADHGLLDMDKQFALASGKYQVLCYKEEIEANLRTPELSGYQLLDLHDYLGQGTALVGILDAFWQTKGDVTAEEFRQYAGPVVPTARLMDRVYRTSQPLDAAIELANFGNPDQVDEEYKADRAWWTIDGDNGQHVVTGKLDPTANTQFPIGKNIAMGRVHADMSTWPAPAHYKLTVYVNNRGQATNSWDFWLYPENVDVAVPASVMITSDWNQARQGLATGGKVIFHPLPAALDNTSPPLNNVPVFWNRQMNPKLEAMLGLLIENKHPALAGFPSDTFCNWQWIQIVTGMKTVNLDKAPRELKPIVWAIDDWNRNFKLGVVFECKVGPGSLIVCAPDIMNDLANHTVARQLRKSLVDYAESAAFNPPMTLSEAQASALFPGSPRSAAPGAVPTATPPDINEGPAATQVIR